MTTLSSVQTSPPPYADNVDTSTPSALQRKGSMVVAQASSGGSANWLDAVGAFSPDALVYTNRVMNLANTRHFVLANPLSGSYTQFISHKSAPVVKILGVPFKRVEAVHYSLVGKGTRREDGFTWSQANRKGDVVVFANVRGGDTNLHHPVNGVSVNAGFFGSPRALIGLADRLANSGNGKVRALGQALRVGLNAASATDSQFGFAWRATLTYNNQTRKVELDFSGFKIPLGEFQAAVSEQGFLSEGTSNEGAKSVARANNYEAYLHGANPYANAVQTRAPNGAFVNHGDPVADIAGRIVTLGRLVNPGAPDIRTNAQAKQALEEAIDRNFPALTPAQRRLLRPEDVASLRPDPLSAPQREYLNATLALLERYKISGLFGSAKIRAAAADAGQRSGVSGQSLPNLQFVRDVFEGDFRTASTANYDVGDMARDVVLGVSRIGAVLVGMEAGTTDNYEAVRKLNDAALTGLRERLQAQHGGMLKALNLNTSGLTVPQRQQYEAGVLQGLFHALQGKAYEHKRVPTGQVLYQEFRALSAADRAGIAARLNVALRSPK